MARKRIQIDEFFPAYMEAVKASQTLEEFAEGIGLKPGSISTRIRELQKQGLPVPSLKSSETRERRTIVDKVREMLGQYGIDSAPNGEAKKKSRPKKEKVVRPEPDPDPGNSDEALKEIFG